VFAREGDDTKLLYCGAIARLQYGLSFLRSSLCWICVGGQFFGEPAVWKGTDLIGREVVLYISPEGRFFSEYPYLTYADSDGHGVWSIDAADNTIRCEFGWWYCPAKGNTGLYAWL